LQNDDLIYIRENVQCDNWPACPVDLTLLIDRPRIPKCPFPNIAQLSDPSPALNARENQWITFEKSSRFLAGKISAHVETEPSRNLQANSEFNGAIIPPSANFAIMPAMSGQHSLANLPNDWWVGGDSRHSRIIWFSQKILSQSWREIKFLRHYSRQTGIWWRICSIPLRRLAPVPDLHRESVASSTNECRSEEFGGDRFACPAK
jgi:hypothetical protein